MEGEFENPPLRRIIGNNVFLVEPFAFSTNKSEFRALSQTLLDETFPRVLGQNFMVEVSGKTSGFS